jgi:hypothetical protein
MEHRSIKGECFCKDEYTAPRCFSPDGFDDRPSYPEPLEMEFISMALPSVLQVWFIVSVMASIASVCLFSAYSSNKPKQD